MGASGAVPEQEAAEAGGGHQGQTQQGCLFHDGREAGRQGGSKRTCLLPSLSYPGCSPPCFSGPQFLYLQNGQSHPCPAHGRGKTSGRALYTKDLTHRTRAVPQYTHTHVSQGSRSVL